MSEIAWASRASKRRITSWLYPGATDTKDVYVDGIYEERSYNCSAPGLPGKHYMAFGRMLATRTGSTLVYILADHLDSTRGTVNASGGALATISYWPFGAVRSGWVGTDKQYTGQQKEFVSTLGAYYYNARFYSTTLGTFMSADTAHHRRAQPLRVRPRQSAAVQRPERARRDRRRGRARRRLRGRQPPLTATRCGGARARGTLTV